ncbi:HemK family protein methyltransferase [Streptomyces lunalinharesii]|uniref:Peptide chain release factor N(5)-glutamine methyltransferase n=1 Tax=Streptomyces lunalinharesii TaxID=333384 RepID=A0ABN3SKR3_9ACTN
MTATSTALRLWLVLRDRLKAARTPQPDEDAAALVAAALGTRSGAIRWLDEVPEDQVAVGHRLCARRTDGEPLAYVLGAMDFRGLRLSIDERVLVPRRKTETLAALAAEELGKLLTGQDLVRVADVGTGSGAVLLYMLTAGREHTGRIRAYGLDCSHDALDVARSNAASLGLQAPVQWLQGDLVDPLPQRVHLMTVNLPYLPAAEVSAPPPETLREPTEAVFGGGTTGIETLRRFYTAAPGKVTADGMCLAEVPETHAEELHAAALAGFRSAELLADLSGVPRLLLARCSRDTDVEEGL